MSIHEAWLAVAGSREMAFVITAIVAACAYAGAAAAAPASPTVVAPAYTGIASGPATAGGLR